MGELNRLRARLVPINQPHSLDATSRAAKVKRTGFKSLGTGIKRGTSTLTSKKPMKQVSDKRREYSASEDGKADSRYRHAVLQRPCVICRAFGLVQTSPTTGHHPIHDRILTDSDKGEKKPKGKRKAADKRMIPLCDGHHQGNFDTSKVAVHREPEKWREIYGNDFDYVEQTQIAILGEERE